MNSAGFPILYLASHGESRPRTPKPEARNPEALNPQVPVKGVLMALNHGYSA